MTSQGTRLAGKVAVISGASRGMGLSHTRAFLDQGARVVAFDLNEDAGQTLVKEYGADRVVFLRGDVRTAADWSCVVQAGVEQFGAINVLVNNAGVSPLQRLESVTEADYRRVIDINQVGTFLGMQAVIPAMRESGGGSIVNIASSAALVGFADIFSYVASKWAVRGMTKAAALELVEYGIRVNAVCPGDTDTPMIRENAKTPSASMPPAEDLPFGRWARPGEISAAAVFLASDESSYMSGTEVVVDGAFTAQ